MSGYWQDSQIHALSVEEEVRPCHWRERLTRISPERRPLIKKMLTRMGKMPVCQPPPWTNPWKASHAITTGLEVRVGSFETRNSRLCRRCLRGQPALSRDPADGETLELRCGLQGKLLLDVRAVHIHRLGTEVQAPGNLVRAPAFPEQPQHL